MNKISILVIDDEDDKHVVAEMLQKIGYNAVFLHNDKRAPLQEQDVITALQGVDVLLTDGFMTGLDGADMIRIALEQGLSVTRACVMTGYLKGDLPQRINALGAIRILEKPFGMDELRQFMDEVCAAVPAM